MKYAVVDLFAGAGGLSHGFSKAGFNLALAVEKDLWASETHAHNHPNVNLIVKDILEVSDSEFKGYKGAEVVVGGPPCQGFSISASNRRKSDDPRNYLYREFIRAVSNINPLALVIENVKEIQKFILPDGRRLCVDIQERLFELGYFTEVITLNASNFDVPQDRHRSFIIGGKNKEKLSRVVQILLNQNSGLNLYSNRSAGLTLWEAISDLPPVVPLQVREDEFLNYGFAPANLYQEAMRAGAEGVYNHVPMRHTPRMIERFSHMIANSTEMVSMGLPKELGPRVRSNPDLISDVKYSQNHRLLQPHRVSPTITASFYSSFIHPYQPRNLTVREAARLQSFPDNYIFKGKRTTLSKKLLEKKGVFEDLYLDQFNQVGNSVPPNLAYHIALQLKALF